MKLSITLATALISSSMFVGLPTNVSAASTKGEFQVARTPVMYCSVKTQSGLPLRIRQAPSTNSQIVGRVANGAVVTIEVPYGSEGGAWSRVVRPTTGFVANAYLTKCRY